jgi:uncharacterized cofD-like protein
MYIVTLGSGTGQATVLRGLQAYDCQITAVVGVTDNGGHSGALRRALHMPQVGDTRQCLSALVDETSVWGQLLRHRFTQSELNGVSVGNLILAALSSISGQFSVAVEAVCRAAGIMQQVLPVSDAETNIAAELEDGQQVIGEWQIMQRQPRTDVARLFLQPSVKALPQVLEAIAAADIVVLCPGSLLTGTIALLLHEGVRESIAASSATCLYICNLMTQPGQTDGYTARRHLATLSQYLGSRVDGVLVNDGVLPPQLVAYYARHGSQPVQNDLTSDEAAVVYSADLVEHPDVDTIRAYTRPQGNGMQVGLHLIRHDAAKLAAQIMTRVPTSPQGQRD